VSPDKRIKWTSALRDRFIEVVSSLGGVDEAKPSEVLDRMKIPGLTRTHVKIYLQKYRMMEDASSSTAAANGARTRRRLDALVSTALNWMA
jgi:SHAQKYF class myb-like DNA-binding protein